MRSVQCSIICLTELAVVSNIDSGSVLVRGRGLQDEETQQDYNSLQLSPALWLSGSPLLSQLEGPHSDVPVWCPVEPFQSLHHPGRLGQHPRPQWAQTEDTQAHLLQCKLWCCQPVYLLTLHPRCAEIFSLSSHTLNSGWRRLSWTLEISSWGRIWRGNTGRWRNNSTSKEIKLNRTMQYRLFMAYALLKLCDDGDDAMMTMRWWWWWWWWWW